ncbi:hypothetical protein PACTADRAFT_2458 [Pachysolen tannophilus NRRL Y-2460]|uniref:SH3 domain-containing protein n=1 Tax=Pachysolen tannophilus NRRL Y-2460 TaxID=669874 RepID=A0A1E4TWK6_PACTA|nr:hypothetical protein PACTADRAFT_2458 [Pachysolen tannophilus NRRL Y-2460]
MSFKGFRKTVVRAPQTFRQKLNMGVQTVDAIYVDAERRFQELEVETKKLEAESKRYFNAVNGMLEHQIGFSKGIEEIYNPISGKVSDPTTLKAEGSLEGIEAAKQYREVVAELQQTLKPDLELIETRIIGPAQELIKVIESIRKMATKRGHKLLDLDRHNNTLKKYQDKKEKTPKDEEKLYKAEADVAIAQQEYDYYNEMLKNELPVLFQLESEFIKPLFVSLYYMQLNIFYTLYTRMEELKIPYFDLSSDIIEAFQIKRGDIQEQAEAIGITHFKVGHARAKLEATKRRYAAGGAGTVGSPAPSSPVPGSPYSPVGTQELPAYTPPATGAYGQQPVTAATTAQGYPNEKAAYAQNTNSAYASPTSYTSAPSGPAPAYGSPAYGSPAYGSPMSPTVAGAPQQQQPLQQPAQQATETCTALYDYAAQAEGDLSFSAGAVIEIVQRTADVNGWWTGRINGVQGVFPGNYVQLNH